MIQAINISKGYGEQILLEHVSFTLGKGERVGLVGRNGTGKTTLFKIILGEDHSDSGEIVVPKNYRLGTLKQHLHFTESTILAECMTSLHGDAQYDQYKVEKMLMGLGFKESDFERSPSDFSGGYQIRINLAKVLLSEPNCLLLDEPTNYLDIVSLRWLKRFLISFQGEVILITHDRGFMDEVITHTMGIWRQKLVKISGGTEKYYEQIILEEEIHEKTRANSERKRKELEDFVTRFKAKASKAAQAQSRLKMLEKMGTVEALSSVSTLDFEFNHKECPGKVLMEIKNLSFGYNEDYLFSNLNFPILKGDKIAIIGKNGKGKSTLLNILAGELVPKIGNIQKNVNTLVGHFGQTNITRLYLNHTIEEEIASVDPTQGTQRVRNICATMMFSGPLAEKKISVLSGGERARVLLGKILARPTNLLLLDEPTNHLDQESIEALMLELQNYEGAVVIVTHAENLIRNVATKLVVFHHNNVEFLDMGYEEFLTKYGWEEEAPMPGKKAVSKLSRNDQKRLRSEIIMERSKQLSPLKKQMEKFEKDILKLEEEQIKLEAELIGLAQSGDSKKIQQTSFRLGIIKKDVEEFFEQLAEVTLKHDELFLQFENRLSDLEA